MLSLYGRLLRQISYEAMTWPQSIPTHWLPLTATHCHSGTDIANMHHIIMTLMIIIEVIVIIVTIVILLTLVLVTARALQTPCIKNYLFMVTDWWTEITDHIFKAWISIKIIPKEIIKRAIISKTKSLFNHSINHDLIEKQEWSIQHQLFGWNPQVSQKWVKFWYFSSVIYFYLTSIHFDCTSRRALDPQHQTTPWHYQKRLFKW